MSTSDERGLAVMEALILGIVLIFPMMWLLSVLSAVHSAALATNSAVREAGMVIAGSLGRPPDIEMVVKDALRNHGLDAEGGSLELDAPQGFGRGNEVGIALGYEVPIFDPPFLQRDLGPTVTVRARYIARIDPYRSR